MEDYEKANAREWDLHKTDRQAPSQDKWQVVNISKQTAKAPQRSSPQKWRRAKGNEPKAGERKQSAPKFVTKPDDEAQQAWRQREPPKESVRIPDDLAMVDKGHILIARQHGAFVFSEHRKGNNGFMTFGIWGSPQAVSATKKAINAWIEDWQSSTKSRRASRFAKVVSLTPVLRERAEKEWKKEVKRHRFRQYPPPDMGFGAIGSFHWPVKEYRPEEILGMSYEALDPIRMDCSCYVVFVKDRSSFQVMGKADAVQEGLLRLRATCFQIAARQITGVRMYHLHWDPDTVDLPTCIKLETYTHPCTTSGGDNAPEKPGCLPRAEGDSGVRADVYNGVGEGQIKTSIFRTLRKLHYYRGSIQMRVRLGAFLATQYRVPKDGIFTLDEYHEMLSASQFIGRVTEEIGDRSIEDAALNTFQGAQEMLCPADGTIDSLEDVKPTYSAVFTFADDAGDLQLSVYAVETQDAFSNSQTIEKVSNGKWTRLERDTGTESATFDVSLSNPNTGMAWQFDIKATQTIDTKRLPKALSDFEQSIKFDAKPAQRMDSGQPFVSHKPYVGHLKSIQERITYHFNVTCSEYFIELTKYRYRTLSPRTSVVSPAPDTTVYEPRWSLSLFCKSWDRSFAVNDDLAIGKRADWSDDVETWFPEEITKVSGQRTGVGFEQFMGHLQKLEKLIRETKVEELLGGMTVG